MSSPHPLVAPSTPRPPRLLARVDSPWRAPLAACCLIAAAAHVPVTGEHLAEAAYIGVLFIALEVAAVLIASALLRRPVRAVPLAAVAVGALAVLALVISRTAGLPLMADDVGRWSEPLAQVSLVAEVGMVLAGLAVAAGRIAPTRRTMLSGALAGLLVLAGGALSIGAAASAPVQAEDGGVHEMHDMHHMDGMDMGLPAAGRPAADLS